MKTETDGQKMLRFSGNRYGENANQFILVIRRMSAQIKKSFYKGDEKMKNFKKPLSLAIAILMIATLFCVPSYADPVSTTSWKNGEMPTVEEMPKSDSSNYKADENGDWLTHFYEDTDVFSYVAFVKATNATSEGETRSKGFYPMGVATTEHPNLNGQTHWFRKGYYTPAYQYESTTMMQDKAKNTWSNGVAFCAGNHYAPGVAFTAPQDGTVEFTFDYILNLISPNNKWSNRLLVGRSDMSVDNANGNKYSNVLYTYTAEDVATSGKQTQQAGTDTIRLDVVAGEKIYFIIDGSGAGESRFWITEVNYIEEQNNSATVDVKARMLAAEDELKVAFLIQNLEEDAAPTVVFTVNGEALESSVPVKVVDSTGKYGKNITFEDQIYLYVVSLSAKQMTDIIELYVDDGEGNNALPEEDQTYTIETYCQYWINAYAADTSNETLKNVAGVCASMLLYGRTAQIYFNYRKEDLPALDATAQSLIDAAQNN